MGVRGLLNFLNHFETGISERIDINKEIQTWKDNKNDETPIILVDLKEVGYFIQRDEIGTILGGRYDYYNLMLRKLFKNISKYHAKLVFFLPGKSHTDDLPIFIPKAEFFYKNSMEIFDKIRQQIDLQTIKNSFSYHIRNTYAFRYNFRKLLSKYGEFRITYIEHNREIARYAKQHRDQVLAIISNDTDFMVFDGDYEFWITGSINATEMQCTRYNRHELYRRLGFTNGSFEMRLLSALCGSNYLPIYVVSKFITHLTKSNSDKTKYGKIWSVSAYVRQQTIEMVDGKLKYDLHKISRDVFGDDYETAELNAISNGIARYDLEFPESDEFCDGSAKKNGFLRFCQLHDSFIYKLVTDDIFLVPDSSYIDYQRFRTKHFAQLILPILMKICGILFKDDKPRPATRQICMKHAHDEPCKLTDETIIYPTMALPELFDLIFKWNETTFDKYRGPLIEWVLGLNDGFVAKVNSIKQFKNNLSAVIITLEYLIKQKELTAVEANAILYTEHEIRTLGAIHTTYPRYANAETVRIAHLYVKIYMMISRCMSACGLHKLTDLIRFDGALFHKNLNCFENATAEEMEMFRCTIEPIWVFR